MSKRRNSRRREHARELATMLPIPLPGGSLDMDTLPDDARKVVHLVAAWLESLGCDGERATDAALAHVTWAARVAGVWPAVVARARG